ncbi:glycosyltransferase family 2 protein [Halobaculum sp. WSA2]|uniref:Glycosyltransferase family 2 protein n=1 Tax=Halobaculum saliterrae TaxID=2073113 RepID=A0A6B0SWA9_9EURY|nr:glycosyltransferase family 2 protein [Halobaculum saliterrae]MXR40532.1 glycosyltransferase family 2 protein [Halobaculum saliterrae]
MEPIWYASLGFSVFGWTILLIFFGATLFWLGEMLIVGRAPQGPIEHPPSAVEVRVLTRDAEAVVQGTVNSLPDNLAATRVVAETDIDILGASVHIVPDDFTCEAIRKARAVEWARREVECVGEFVLYIDEDTLLGDFHGLPDADMIQLAERPIRSASWLTYLAEMFRMGFQLEQATFPKFRYPLYAWGGGFAVRKQLEDVLTWDVETVTEDTNFVWRAARSGDYDLQYLDVKAMNQAPPSIREMIHQRRRWISGAARDSHLLPLRYRLLSLMRNAAWALVFVSPALALPLVTPIENLFFPTYYWYIIVFQLVGLFGWAFLGYWYFAERVWILALLFITIPVVALIHSAGAFWAVLSPTETFRVTKKVSPLEIADERLREYNVSEHTKTGQRRGQNRPGENAEVDPEAEVEADD